MKIVAIAVPLFIQFAFAIEPGRSNIRTNKDEILIMWYNVENLFHPENDSIPGDDEFTPEGVRRWTYNRYKKKLTALSKVIISAGGWDPPDLVGLCEVEDATVLEDLVRHPILAPYQYQFIHRDSPDRRGMDVACLYREKRIQPKAWEVIKSEATKKESGTRDILHIWAMWGKGKSLDLFLVHLISKYSGAGATAELRKRQVGQLLNRVDSVQKIRVHSLKVMAGDFNEELEGYSMEPAREWYVGEDSIAEIHLEGRFGSYKYRGRWSRIDQFLVCGEVEKYRMNGSILELPALFLPDETYGGIKPNRTYLGYLYQGGISDHLPILLKIKGHPLSGHFEP